MKRFRGLGVLACLIACAMLLMGASGGCGSNLHKATVAAGSIAATLHSAAETNHTNAFETVDERVIVANYIAQAAAANDNFIGVLQDAQKNGGKIDNAAILDAFTKLSAQIDQLNAMGVLHLKSQQAQADFAIAISSIQAQLAALQVLVGAKTASNHLPVHRRSLPLMAITLTATEIEELIALAVSVGSALVPKLLQLRSESDPQILAMAEEDDKAAIEQAEADGATPPKGAS